MPNDYLDEDLQTPELDRFLAAGVVPKRLRDEALRAAVTRAFEPTSRELEDYPQPENHPARVLALYRIIRAMTRACSVTAEDETLDSSLATVEPDPWYDGIIASPTPIQQQLLRKMTQNCLLDSYIRAKEHFGAISAKIMANKPKLPEKTATKTEKTVKTKDDNKQLLGVGIPLLPNPFSATKTQYWHEVATQIANELNIYYTDVGARGMQGLFHPHTAQYAGVTPKQIMACEDLLVDEAQRLLIRVGERPAIDKFRSQYGFSRNEAISLIRLCRAEALRMDGSTIDENRAIMVAMLKDFTARCKSSLNQRDELASLKELSKVQGLLRTAPEDMAMDFLDVINRVAARQDRLKSLTEGDAANPLVAGPTRVLTLRSGASVPLDEGEDEDEDLEAFDEEQGLMR